jgi:hypothetical protein
LCFRPTGTLQSGQASCFMCARFRRAFACSTRCRGRRIDDPSGRPGAHT